VPLLNALHAWMIETVSRLDNKSGLAIALNYSLNRWEALCRYTKDGRLEIDNTIAERSLGQPVRRRGGTGAPDGAVGIIPPCAPECPRR
jgi:hypothetical protein